MAKTNFILYKDFKQTLDILNDDQAGKLFKAVFEYVEDRTEPNFDYDGMLKVAFTILKTQLERDLVKYKQRVKRNQENGRKGGRPTNKEKETHSVIDNPHKPTGIKNNPTKAKKADSVSGSVSDSVRDSDKKDKKEKITLRNVTPFNNIELDELFNEFLMIRKKLKAVNSERAIQLQLNKLNKFDDSIKKQMLENAIANSWKSVYELKQNGYKKNNLPNDITAPEWLDDYL